MRRVLIIANLYHAFPRIPGIATYLPEFGWEPTIVTPPIGGHPEKRFGFPEKFVERSKIVEVPYRGDIFWFWRRIFKLLGYKVNESITEQIKEQAGISSKRSLIDDLMNWYQTLFAYPDTEKGWKKPALKAVCELLEKEQFDVLVSSFPYPTSHIVASEIKKQFGLPWLADFRDTWTENPIYPFSHLRKALDKRLEKRTMQCADAFVTVSFPYARKLRLLSKRDINVISNGFDPTNIENTAIFLTKKFTMTYVGTIYTGKQDPEKCLIAIRSLIVKGLINPNDIEIRFYGTKVGWLENDIMRYGLIRVARQYGVISRSEVLERLRESQILLFFNWEDPVNKGLCHLKFFEYLGARRPILATGGFGNDEFHNILVETKGGSNAPTVEAIETAIRTFYEEYRRCGRVSWNGNRQAVNKYSYDQMAKEFANSLNQVRKKSDGKEGFGCDLLQR